MNQTELCSKRAGLAEQIGSGIKLNLHLFHLETAVHGDVIGKKFNCMPHFEMSLPHISICMDPQLCLDDQLPRLKILPHFKNLATFNLDTSLDGSDRQGSELRSIFGSKFRTLVTRSPELCPRTVPPCNKHDDRCQGLKLSSFYAQEIKFPCTRHSKISGQVAAIRRAYNISRYKY